MIIPEVLHCSDMVMINYAFQNNKLYGIMLDRFNDTLFYIRRR